MGHHSFLFSVRGRCLAYRVSKGPEKLLRYRVLPIFPFGMPLHAKGKALCIAHPYRLICTVRGATLGDKTVRQASNALTVQGVYLNRPCAKQIFENAATFKHDFVSRAVLDVQRIVLVLAMIHAGLEARIGGFLVDVLVQRAAIGDVEFLEAAANGKERQGAVHAGADELQRQRIALAVEQYAFTRRHAAIEFGVNIRMRAGQKNAVAEIEEFGEMIPCFVERLARYRQENGLAIGTAVDCRNIFLADRMKGMRSQHLHVAGNADDGPPA